MYIYIYVICVYIYIYILFLYTHIDIYIYIYMYVHTSCEMLYMRNLLGWLETRLAQNTLHYLKSRLKLLPCERLLNVQLLRPQKDLRKGSISQDVMSFSSELCSRRSDMFAEVACLVCHLKILRICTSTLTRKQDKDKKELAKCCGFIFQR